MIKLALMTCGRLPHGDADDQILIESFSKIGVSARFCVWDEDYDWAEFDACLLRSVWDYHERNVEFDAWIERLTELTQLLNPPEVIRWNTQKTYLKELATAGIDMVPTHWLNSKIAYDLNQILSQSDATQWFLKPIIGADSAGTCRFNNDDCGIRYARQHLHKWLPDVDMMLQPYIQTVETFGETSAILFMGQLSHAVRKIPQSGDYRVQDTFGAEDIAYELNSKELYVMEQCVAYLTEQFGPLLYARLDFLQDNAGVVYLNEAELIEPSLFFNHSPAAALRFAKQTLAMLLDNKIQAQKNPESCDSRF